MTTPTDSKPAKLHIRAPKAMLITSTDSIPGRSIVKVLGLVSGNAVKSIDAGSGLVAGFKSIFGGEVEHFTALMSSTRQLAVSRMAQQATSMGANAVCGLRFVTSEVMQGCSELCAYGTAVVVAKEG